MAFETAAIVKTIPAPAADVWARVRDFCGGWHPAIDWMREERDGHGGIVRVFGVKGETGEYRERLTYLSDSDMVMRYELLSGIDGARMYCASIAVSQVNAGSCGVAWEAGIEADRSRAKAIARGTKAVFEAGIKALCASPRAAPGKREGGRIAPTLGNLVVDGAPKLGVTYSGELPGPLLLFLHGIGGNRTNWTEQMHAISHLCQTAAMDFRGYGGSTLGAAQSRADDHCNDILRVMRELGKAAVILCGLSFGAWIAASFAMRHPEKIAGLVFSGGCTGLSEAPQSERLAFLRLRQEPLDQGRTPADFASSVVDAIAGPDADQFARHVLHDAMAAIPAATYRDAIVCFANPEERFAFEMIARPVLLMTGEHDRLASPVEIRAVAQRIHGVSPRPDVRFEVIERAGHVCNIENAPRYNALLEEFVARLV